MQFSMAHDQMHFIKLSNNYSDTKGVPFLAMSDLLQKICAPQDLSLSGSFKASERFSIRSYLPFWHFPKKAIIGWHGFVDFALTLFMWDFSLNFLKDYSMTLVVYIFSVYLMMMARDWLNFPLEMSLLEDSYPPNYSLTTSIPNRQQKK